MEPSWSWNTHAQDAEYLENKRAKRGGANGQPAWSGASAASRNASQPQLAANGNSSNGAGDVGSSTPGGSVHGGNASAAAARQAAGPSGDGKGFGGPQARRSAAAAMAAVAAANRAAAAAAAAERDEGVDVSAAEMAALRLGGGGGDATDVSSSGVEDESGAPTPPPVVKLEPSEQQAGPLGAFLNVRRRHLLLSAALLLALYGGTACLGAARTWTRVLCSRRRLTLPAVCPLRVAQTLGVGGVELGALEEEEAPALSAQPTMMSKEARKLMLSGMGSKGLQMWKVRRCSGARRGVLCVLRTPRGVRCLQSSGWFAPAGGEIGLERCRLLLSVVALACPLTAGPVVQREAGGHHARRAAQGGGELPRRTALGARVLLPVSVATLPA